MFYYFIGTNFPPDPRVDKVYIKQRKIELQLKMRQLNLKLQSYSIILGKLKNYPSNQWCQVKY